MTILEYFSNRQKKQYSTYIYRGGEGFYIENGIEVPEKEFDAKYPTNVNKLHRDIKKYHKGDNPDKTKIV